MAPADFHAVLSALEQGPVESAAAREMLRAALPHALEPIAAGGEPHAYQAEILAAVRSALDEGIQAAKGQRQAAEEAAAAVRSEVEGAEAQAERTAAAVAAATAEVEARLAEVEQRKALAKQAEANFVEAEAATKSVLDARTELLAERESVRAVVAALENANVQHAAGEHPDPTEVVVALLVKRRADKPLIAAAPVSLGLPVGERSDFDRCVVEEIVRFVGNLAQGLDTELAAGEAESKHADAERLGSWAIFDVEQDRAVEASAASAAARGDLDDAKVAHEASSAETLMRKEALSAKLSDETLAETRIKELTDAVAAFERLRSPPPPAPVAEVADQEDSPMASAPTEAPAESKVVDEPMGMSAPHEAIATAGA